MFYFLNNFYKFLFFFFFSFLCASEVYEPYDIYKSPKIDVTNNNSLVLGSSTFMKNCNGCHSLKYMRYKRLATDFDISLDSPLISNSWMFGSGTINDNIETPLSNSGKAEKWFGISPPDLSLVSRSRGDTWLFNYLNTFYKDYSRPLGVNNITFPDTAMPHPLVEVQGILWPSYEDSKGVGDQVLKGLSLIKNPLYDIKGWLRPILYEQSIADLVTFLSYIGEPFQVESAKLGYRVLAFLFVFSFFTFLLKKEYWRDVK